MKIRTIAQLAAISSLLVLGNANALTLEQELQLDLSMVNPPASSEDRFAAGFFGYDDSADQIKPQTPSLVTPGVDHTHNRRTEVIRIGVL